MYTLFVILIVLAALLMIGIVLIQESKGGGLASNFSSSNQIMGVRKTTDVIEKTTWGLAVAMVVLSVLCSDLVQARLSKQLRHNKVRLLKTLLLRRNRQRVMLLRQLRKHPKHPQIKGKMKKIRDLFG